ncbi:MAG: hypothetical protein ABJC04_13525, partial [Verrucomicrobiota bacterium]
MQSDDYKIVQLANGTFSVHSFAESETFHPVIGPMAEAQALYVKQLKLRERLAESSGEFVIWDVGLGAAANVLTILRETKDISSEVRIISFDHKIAPLEFAVNHAENLRYFTDYETPVRKLIETGRVNFTNGKQSVNWEFHLGDFPTLLENILTRSRRRESAPFDPSETTSQKESAPIHIGGYNILPAPHAI